MNTLPDGLDGDITDLICLHLSWRRFIGALQKKSTIFEKHCDFSVIAGISTRPVLQTGGMMGLKSIN